MLVVHAGAAEGDPAPIACPVLPAEQEAKGIADAKLHFPPEAAAAFQQFGFAVAIAVVIDATLILAVLLPAATRLAGDRLWWLPSWLEWLPGKSTARTGISLTGE